VEIVNWEEREYATDTGSFGIGITDKLKYMAGWKKAIFYGISTKEIDG
jgi:hypothetical protein